MVRPGQATGRVARFGATLLRRVVKSAGLLAAPPPPSFTATLPALAQSSGRIPGSN